MKKQLTDILTPLQHQRMIDRLYRKINPATPELNENTYKRIDWHTEQYITKTGKDPR